MRFLLVMTVIGSLAGCVVSEEIVQDTIRLQAKQVVNGQVAQRFPGLNAAPITDCIIDAASTEEILSIGATAVTGVSTSTTDLVMSIAQRPETVSCIASNGTGLLSL